MSDRFEQIRQRNRELATRLLSLSGGEPALQVEPAAQRELVPGDAIVSHIEVNDHHGVGVLLLRLFGASPNLVSIRSQDYYGGRQDFGAFHARISHHGASRDRVISKVLDSIGGVSINRVLAAPYFADDVMNAIALREIFGAPLCTFLMDDQNLTSDGIPDVLMNELLRKSSLRLAISPEMCAAYEAKYGYKFWFMPPVAPTRLIPGRLMELPESALRESSPVILGNIWGQQWLALLRESVRGTGVSIRWFNNGEFRWLSCSPEELEKDGIAPQVGAAHPDDELVEILRRAPFVVLPSGTLEKSDDRSFIAQLSFPSRIPYILATSHTPILVLGSSDTAAARIVARLGIGMNSPYGKQSFLEAASQMRRPEVNGAMRRAAFLLSLRFADLGAAEWIWQSLEQGAPVDRRYEDMMPHSEDGSHSTTYRNAIRSY